MTDTSEQPGLLTSWRGRGPHSGFWLHWSEQAAGSGVDVAPLRAASAVLRTVGAAAADGGAALRLAEVRCWRDAATYGPPPSCLSASCSRASL